MDALNAIMAFLIAAVQVEDVQMLARQAAPLLPQVAPLCSRVKKEMHRIA